MDENIQHSIDDEFSTWFSSYGLITIERILHQLGFHLKHDELAKIIQDKENGYAVFLRLPFKNILNGIILNQAQDYREYAQKLFIDYLLSGTANAPGPEDAPIQAGSTRDLLEKERLLLIEVGDHYDLEEFEHNKLIAESQKTLIALAKKIGNTPLTSDIIEEVKIKIAPYEERAVQLTANLRQYRTQFYEFILRARDMIETLPEYHLDEVKNEENRSTLYFDSNIGEERGK